MKRHKNSLSKPDWDSSTYSTREDVYIDTAL